MKNDRKKERATNKRKSWMTYVTKHLRPEYKQAGYDSRKEWRTMLVG